MRTKTLLLTAAVIAAGIASASAQVFSVNIVGYVTTTIQGGGRYTLLSNPVDAGTNSSIATLFADVAAGTTIYKWNGTGFVNYTKSILGTFPAAASTATLVPGEGAFVQSSATATNATITFVGEVQQGLLTNAMPAGFSIVSSRVPVSGTVSALGYTNAVAGDTIFKWDPAAGGYVPSTLSILGTWGGGEPTINVGEAVFINNGGPRVWVRNFVAP